MKMSLPILTLLLIFILSSCSKNAPITSQGNDTPPKDSLPKIDSLPFPLTIGTWWKYKRNDTTISTGNPYSPPKIDSSIEIITVVGKTKLTDSVQAALLQVKNLTTGKTDTSFAFYYRSNFIVSQYKSTDLSSYAKAYFLRAFDMRFRLPLVDGTYKIMGYDSIYIKKDTTVAVLNKQFQHCLFTYESFDYFQGAFKEYFASASFIGNNIGFLYWRALYGYKSHYGYGGDSWYVRRIMDYYIAP